MARDGPANPDPVRLGGLSIAGRVPLSNPATESPPRGLPEGAREAVRRMDAAPGAPMDGFTASSRAPSGRPMYNSIAT